MRNWLKLGSWNVLCDVCGQKFKADQVMKRWDGLITCKDDWEMRHPQDFIRVRGDKQTVPFVRDVPPDQFTGYVCSVNECYPLADSATADCARIGWNAQG